MLAVGGEQEAVIADSLPKNAFPVRAVESFDVSAKWVGSHLVDDAGDALLNGPWEVFKIPRGVLGKLTVPAHA
jgi:hypothetical protein